MRQGCGSSLAFMRRSTGQIRGVKFRPFGQGGRVGDLDGDVDAGSQERVIPYPEGLSLKDMGC